MSYLYLKDFGAVGDGVTNDGPALHKACKTLSDSKPGTTLVLESNKTYYIRDTGTSVTSAITILKGSGIAIKGDNTTILVDPTTGMYYADIENTEGFTMEGLNFNLSTKPFFVGTITEMDVQSHTLVMTIDRPLSADMKTGMIYTNLAYGLPDSPQGRAHMFIDRIEVLDADSMLIKLYIRESVPDFFFDIAKDYKFIGPIPKIGFAIERAFTVDSNTDFTMKNCKIYSFSKFHMAFFNNEGVNRFINVNIVPDPDDCEVNFTGWCDGFHVKENRGKVIWENCKVSGLTDDVFNISASTMYVKTAFSGSEIDMYWPEMNDKYRPLKVGDELTIIDTKTGKLVGRTKVAEVVAQEGTTNRIKLAQDLGEIPTGEHIFVFFDSMVAPGSEIKNCDLDGTFRFRGPITISNTKMHNRRLWIDMYRNLEGPVPRNITFRNCDIQSDGPGCIEIKDYNPNPHNEGTYKIENIVFENCTGIKETDFDLGQAVSITVR